MAIFKSYYFSLTYGHQIEVTYCVLYFCICEVSLLVFAIFFSFYALAWISLESFEMNCQLLSLWAPNMNNLKNTRNLSIRESFV